MAYVTWVLRHCNHNGFPVVRGSPGDSEDDNSDSISLNAEDGQCSREGPLEGVILRSQLMVLLINKVLFHVVAKNARGVTRRLACNPECAVHPATRLDLTPSLSYVYFWASRVRCCDYDQRS